MPHQHELENTVAVNARVFEDNFNVLSQIITNNINYTEEHFGDSETDNSRSTNNIENVEKRPLTQSFRYYLLIMFSCIYLIYGCQNSLLGPAMSDLSKILDTTSANISVAQSLKSFIFTISTILISFLFKIFGNRQLQYGGAVFAIGLITGLTPHLNSFRQYLICCFFSGFASALVDSVTNLVVLELFSLNSKVYMQIAHGSYTFGTVFGPLLVGPYLSRFDNSSIPSNHTDPTTTTTTTTTTTAPTTTTTTTLKPTTFPNHNETTTTKSNLEFLSFNDSLPERYSYGSDEYESRIYIPYSMIAFLLLIAGVTVIALQLTRPYTPEKRKLAAKQKSKRVVEPLEEQIQDSQAASTSSSSQEISRSSANNSAVTSSTSSSNKKLKTETVCQQINLPKTYYRTFLGLTGLLISTYTCVDGLTGLFMPSFLSKGELKIEKDEAAFMSSLIYMSMATGRLFTIIFAFKTTCKILLFFNISMILLGYITLTYFAVHSKLITWITMLVIGGGQSSTYPLILSYIENRIVITNNVQLYLLFSSTILLVFGTIIVGYYIDTAPMMFTYINLTLAIVALALMLSIHATDIWKRKLIKKIKEDQQNLVDEDD